jgi:hypothetical protein
LDEKLVLTDVAETVTPRSRLASSVRLTRVVPYKAMAGWS